MERKKANQSFGYQKTNCKQILRKPLATCYFFLLLKNLKIIEKMDYKTIQKQKTLNVMFACPNMQQAVAITDEIDTVCTVQELRWNGQARVATVILDRKASADKIQQVFSEF